MKPEFVNPFVSSVYETFSTMLSAKAIRTGLSADDGTKPSGALIAIIGFSGSVKGTVAMSMNWDTARSVVERLIGETNCTDEATLTDTISELVNIIAGSAKSRLSMQIGETLELSLPAVVKGEDYELYSPSKSVWLSIPFETEIGPVTVRISIQS